MLLDYVLHSDETISVYGVTAIFDMKDVTLGHALQLHPALVKRYHSVYYNSTMNISPTHVKKYILELLEECRFRFSI